MKNKTAFIRTILAGVILAAFLLVFIGISTRSSCRIKGKGEDHIGFSKVIVLNGSTWLDRA